MSARDFKIGDMVEVRLEGGKGPVLVRGPVAKIYGDGWVEIDISRGADTWWAKAHESLLCAPSGPRIISGFEKEAPLDSIKVTIKRSDWE